MRKKVAIINEKGLKLAAVIETPSEKTKCPFVLILHGFKGYKEEEHYVSLSKRLVDKGIGSVRFDASGFGESDGTVMNDYRFSNYVSDTESVYEYIKTLEFVNSDRIGVFGQSMGGMQAIVFTANHPEVKALCVVSSPERMATVDELGKKLKIWKKKRYLELDSSRQGRIKVPYEFIEDGRKWDMLEHVNKINVQTLFILGLKDKTVFPGQTRKVFEAANEPKELWEVEGMDHFYKKDEKLIKKVNEKVISFFQSYL
jgi:pimeloyl-ACP methyl ester carboxylesterase